MSSLNVQDEVTDSGKDDENNVITAPTRSIDNADGDSANVQIDNNLNPTSPKTSEQTSAVSNTNENIGESSSPKNYEEIVVKTLSKTDKSLAGNFESKESITVESGYKETVIDDDDFSDDFELRWSDDENDDKTSLLLSDEALKKLDEELGIDVHELNDNNRDVSHNVEATAAKNLKDLEITKKRIDNSQMETDNSSSGTVLNIDKNLKQKTKEVAGIVMPDLPGQTNETEIVKNIIAVSSVSSENIETTIKQLINVKKDTDVTKQEKIGEIDDTRVNVTSIIAQDKDSIKQIEQDNNKPDNTSVEKEDIVEISDTVEIKAKSGATKSDLDVEELKRGDVKAMELDYPPKLENKVSTIVSLDDISTSQKENNVSKNTIVFTVSEEQENNGSESSPYIIDIPTNVGISSDCKKLEVNAIKDSESMELSENDITIESNADSIQDVLEEPNLDKEEMPPNRNATVDEANLTISNISDDFKLNKEHRINRPNVMLDIPTQEFDFNEFDDTCDKQDQCDKTVDIKSDLTTKTITEIVNQMAKENAEGMDIDNNADIVPKVIEQQENITTCSMIEDSNSSNETSSINMKMETEPCENEDNEIVQKDLPTLNSEHAEIENIENLENSPAVSGTDEKALEMDVVTSDNADIVSEKADKSLQDNIKATVNGEKLNNQPQINETEAIINKIVTIDNIQKSNNVMDIETISNNLQLDTISIERENLDVEPSPVAEAKETQDVSKSNKDTLESKATENVKQTEAEFKINEKPDIQTSTSQKAVSEPHEKFDIHLRTVITEKEKQNAQPSTLIEATAIKTEIIDFENPESQPTGKEHPLTSVEVIKTKDKDDKNSKDSNDKHVQPSTSIEATIINTDKIDAEKLEIKPTDKEKPSNSVEVIKQKDKDDNKSDVCEDKYVQPSTSTEANAIKTETIDVENPETEQADKEKSLTSVEVITPKDKDDKKDNCVQPSFLIKATAIKTERIDVVKPEPEPADKEKSSNSCEVMKQKDKDDKKSDDSEDKCVQPSTLTDATEIKTETIDVKNLQTKPTDKEKPSTSVEVIKPEDKDDKKSDNSEDKLNQPLTSEVTRINKEKMDVKKPEAEPTDKEKPSTSSEFIKPTDKDDKQSENSTEQFEVQPSTSTAPDIAEETQEVEDRLGLLAESSRVIDDDDDEEDPEPEEDEPDDVDDDDFDPEAEDNSNQTEDHSEESNPPNSDIDIQEEGIDIEFSDVVKTAIDSYGASFDSLLDSADMKVEDSDITMDTCIDKEVDNELQKTSPLKEVPSTEKTEESVGTDKQSTDRARSLLADLLTKPAADMNLPKSGKVAGMQDSCVVVDLEESSSEEDGKVKEKAPSGVHNDQQFNDMDKDKNITEEVTKETKSTKTVTEILKESNKDKSKTAEILSLDSDDDDKAADKEVTFIQKPREGNKCINYNCSSDENVPYYLADRMTILFYGAARKRRRPVCQNCLDVVNARNEGLVSGIRDLRPLMSLRMARPTQTLLEISDSDSDSEGEDDLVGEKGASLLEDQLTDIFNDVWSKYSMDDRFKETEQYLEDELAKMQKQSEEVDKLLRDCQMATDKLRVEFYSSFENPRKELPSMSIHDTPIASYACMESDEIVDEGVQNPQFSLRYPKRRSTTMIDTMAKKQATQDNKRPSRYNDDPMLKHEDDKDISVVRLSAETAPSELPPAGEPSKPPLRVGALVFAMKNQYGAWLKGKVLEVQPKTPEQQFTMCRVRFEHKLKNPCKMLSARSIAYTEPCEVRMTIGTRVIALFKNSENTNKKGEFYYSGVVAEIPNPVNGYRYLVFFDDGYAQYVEHKHTRLVYESKPLVWEEVHPFSRDFVCNYLMKYPERPMVRLHPDQSVTVEWNGKWWVTKVVQVDAALVHIRFPDGRTEWIYRGSTRLQPLFTELQAARRTERTRMPRGTKTRPGAGRLDAVKANVPYVEYTRSDDPPKDESLSVELFGSSARSWELRRQRSVAKKSTTTIAQQIGSAATDGLGLISRVVYYTPKNTVRPLKMVPHTCGPQCKRSDLLTLNDLRTYNPLTKPLLSGWERQIIRYKASRTTMYRAPCGRRLRNERELHTYLRTIHSDMAVDLFDFDPNVHCLAEFVLNKSHVQKKDLSHGKENVPVPCVNYYDHSLPEFCSYNTERTPTSGVPLNLDPDFLCGCDCEDDCVDKTKCACWKMTLEGAKTIGIEGPNVGYHYRRLPEPLPSGIYECNSRCKCKSTCLNRVAQNPLQLKLQVFKTLNRGWGIRALNDIPKGAFICIYAGNLLTDATANLDGLNEGDEYLAELDYIEVVESMKEGYEDDIPEADKKIGKKNIKVADSEPDSESSESEEEERADKTDTEDGDFRPAYMTLGLTEFNKRLRRRDKKKAEKEEEQKKDTKESIDDKTGVKKEDEECITISDDEEVRVSQREPSRFAAEELMTDNKIEPKYRSIRTYFGKDEACYIMDAKVQGNIGRYLNHSCCPNVFVQNVFVDTHDPRFPWVSFFALHHIRAGTELTWNYNYDIGSVPGKVLYCYCGAANCRGRLL